MLILTSKYDAMVAAKDAEIAREKENARHWFQCWTAANAACFAHEQRQMVMAEELATTYIRDAKGQIRKHPSAQVTQ